MALKTVQCAPVAKRIRANQLTMWAMNTITIHAVCIQ